MVKEEFVLSVGFPSFGLCLQMMPWQTFPEHDITDLSIQVQVTFDLFFCDFWLVKIRGKGQNAGRAARWLADGRSQLEVPMPRFQVLARE